MGCTPGRSLSLEKIDDTLIKVIARIHDFHLALMFKVLDDLATRRNLLRDEPGIFTYCVVNEIPRSAVHSLGRGHDRVDHGRDEAWQFRMLRDNLAGRLNRTAALVPENDNQRRSQMLGTIFDRAHGRRVSHIAGISNDEQLAQPDAAEDQLR